MYLLPELTEKVINVNIGITGQPGFIGTRLYNFFKLKKDEVLRIPFEDNYFEDNSKL